jgi:hypothetical protein
VRSPFELYRPPHESRSESETSALGQSGEHFSQGLPCLTLGR